MKTINKLYILVLALLMVGCSHEDFEEASTPAPQGEGDIKFEIGFAPQVQTRVATNVNFNSEWEDDDQIGLFAVKREASNTTATLATTGNYMHNVKLTYNKAENKWTGNAYYTNDGEVLDIYAYYPYDASFTDPTSITFAVKLDQSGTAYNQSDLLMAKKATGIAKGDAVNLQFEHMLSLVQVETKEDRANNIGPAGIMQMVLRECITASSLNLSSGILSPDANSIKDIQMQVFQTDVNKYVYRALIPAQNITQGKNVLMMSQFNGNDKMFYAHSQKLELKTNKAQRIEISSMPFISLAKIDKGSFQMGSPDSDTQAFANEKPRHWVKLTQDYRMSKYQITNAQYAAFLNAVGVGSDGKYQTANDGEQVLISTSSGPSPLGLQWDTDKWLPQTGYANHPVIYVSWYGATEFAPWLGGSLPTEAQWEYACRAGTETIYSFGDAIDKDYVNYNNSGHGNKTLAVGTLKPNPWGLYDMHGNVYEWCKDQWDGRNNYPTNATTESDAKQDPLVTSGNNRVIRGGSWFHNAQHCRSAYRYDLTPVDGSGDVGFRVVFPLSSL